MRLLVVEDDPAMASLLQRAMRKEGYAVTEAATGTDALWQALEHDFDAVVLDAMIPAPDGFEVLRRMRAAGRWAPVLVLTARESIEDRVRGLDVGANDYLVKPFHLAELVARLRALVRRASAMTPATAEVYLDPAGHRLVGSAAWLPLTPTEFRLLAALMGSPGTVLRRRELVRTGWAEGSRVNDNTLDQYVARLRKKLGEVEAPLTITTARGVGYRYG